MSYLTFLKHDTLKGRHAYLSPSKYTWLGYTPEKLVDGYSNSFAVTVGTAVHDFAEFCVKTRMKLNKTDKKALLYHLYKSGISAKVFDLDEIFANVALYVNDCIGFRMTPEVPLYYSGYCFGTSDAISYEKDQKVLKIFDLKTGKTAVKFEQLVVYAALFCLEYRIEPTDISDIILRIYQNGDFQETHPEPQRVREVMDIIIRDSDILSTEYGDKEILQ